MIYLGFFLLVVCFLFSHSILHDFFLLIVYITSLWFILVFLLFSLT